MTDYFEGFGKGLDSPATGLFNVTASDSVDLAIVPRALIIGVAGDVKMTGLDGVTDVYPLPVGIIPCRVSRIWATSTTASDIVGLY